MDDEWARTGADEWQRGRWTVFRRHWGGRQSWGIARGARVLQLNKEIKTAEAAMKLADEMDEKPNE